MPNFIRKAIRRHRWNAYGETGRKIREIERGLNSVDAQLWPHDYEWLEAELRRQRVKRQRLHNYLTQEV